MPGRREEESEMRYCDKSEGEPTVGLVTDKCGVETAGDGEREEEGGRLVAVAGVVEEEEDDEERSVLRSWACGWGSDRNECVKSMASGRFCTAAAAAAARLGLVGADVVVACSWSPLFKMSGGSTRRWAAVMEEGNGAAVL